MSDYSKEILLKRVEEAAAAPPDKIIFIGFFDEFDGAKAERIAQKNKSKYLSFGGYNDSERKMLGFFPEYEELSIAHFPISHLTASYFGDKKLSHKDFLGAIIGGGIKRDAIGDIFVAEKSADIFVKSKVAPYIIENINYVGRVAVKFTENTNEFIPPEREYTDINITVPSLRADAIISALTGESRSKAASLISGRCIFKNNLLLESPIKQINEDDIITIRGHGKYLIDVIGGQTKKGRLKLIAKKYK